MKPTDPDREETMPAAAPQEMVSPAYQVERTDDEVVIRIPRGLLPEEQISRFLALLDLHEIARKSALTEEAARELAADVDRAVWEKNRHRVADAALQLPPDTDVAEFMEEIYLLAKIERGRQEHEAGQVVSHEEARRRLGL